MRVLQGSLDRMIASHESQAGDHWPAATERSIHVYILFFCISPKLQNILLNAL